MNLHRLVIAWLYIIGMGFAYADQPTRIVSVGTAVTEWIIKLDGTKAIVGVDTTSAYPSEVADLPKVGYQRTLSAEGIASLKPTLLIGSQEMGPPSVLEQIKALGITVIALPDKTDLHTLQENLTLLGRALHTEERATQAFKNYQMELTQLNQTVANAKAKQVTPNVLLIIGPYGGLLSAGQHTTGDWLIKQAGGVNVAEFNGHKVISNEALLSLNPDVIIIADKKTLTIKEVLAGLIKKTPALAMTKAVKNHKVVLLDATVLVAGLGPRLPEEATKLTNVFYNQP